MPPSKNYTGYKRVTGVQHKQDTQRKSVEASHGTEADTSNNNEQIANGSEMNLSIAPLSQPMNLYPPDDSDSSDDSSSNSHDENTGHAFEAVGAVGGKTPLTLSNTSEPTLKNSQAGGGTHDTSSDDDDDDDDLEKVQEGMGVTGSGIDALKDVRSPIIIKPQGNPLAKESEIRHDKAVEVPNANSTVVRKRKEETPSLYRKRQAEENSDGVRGSKVKAAKLDTGTKLKLSADDNITVLRQEISQLSGLVQSISKSVKNLDDRLVESHKVQMSTLDDVRDLRAVVSLGRHELRTKVESKQQHCEVPFFTLVFSDEVLQIVLEKCLINLIVCTTGEYKTQHPSEHDKPKKTERAKIRAIIGGAALALRVMMFTVNLRKKQNRSDYRTELGKKASEFREGIVLSALIASQKNNFNIFRDDSFDDLQTDITTGGSSRAIKTQKPRIPSWLKKDFVAKEHVTVARMKMEETNTKSAEQKLIATSKKRSEEDIKLAIEASTQLYRRVKDKLTVARTTAKVAFFDEVGYIFSNWKSNSCHAMQGTVKLSWSVDGKDRKYLDLMDVPRSHKKCQNNATSEQEFSRINRANKSQLLALMDDCPEMVLLVEHEVCIRKHGRKATTQVKEEPPTDSPRDADNSDSVADSTRSLDVSQETEIERKETIAREVNLIDISCRFLSGYSSQAQHSSPASFLCSSPDSLRCVYAVAVLMKKLVERVIQVFDKDAVDEVILLDETFVNGLNLRMLMPYAGRMKSGLKSKCVHMYQEVFNSRSNRTPTKSTVYDIDENDNSNSPMKPNRSTQIVNIDE